MYNDCYPFINFPLPYAPDALEPFIDTKTMTLHHDRHLQTYIDNLNKALSSCPRLQTWSLCRLLCHLPQIPHSLQETIRRNAGGVYNHRLYFELLQSPSANPPQGALTLAIQKKFWSLEQFQLQFQEAALSVFGSGYAWLVIKQNQLEIVTTANQNTPLEYGLYPLLVIDVWEHAYYLKHYNQRSAYIDDWFQVINWEAAENRYLSYRKET